MRTLMEALSDGQWIFTVMKPGFLHLAQDVIDRFQQDGWELDQIVTKQLTLPQAHELYAVHKKENFYEDLCKYMSSGRSTAMVLRRPGVISKQMFKETNIIKDEIRKQYGESDMRNVLHSSDSLLAMEHEYSIYF